MGCEIILSARMKALTEMVTPGSSVCDVGCDHGFVSIYLVQQGISPRVLAMDVRQGPLSRAQEHIRQQGLEAYIETRLSDGLKEMKPGEADTLICAGMGGRLMQHILTESSEKVRAMGELILQPQSELPAFRSFLQREGYVITAENMIYEEGKYYPLMKAVPGGRLENYGCVRTQDVLEQKRPGEQEALGDYFGELLLEQRHPVLKQYLLASWEHNRDIMEQLRLHGADSIRSRERMNGLAEEQKRIELALKLYFGQESSEGRSKDEN